MAMEIWILAEMHDPISEKDIKRVSEDSQEGMESSTRQ